MNHSGWLGHRGATGPGRAPLGLIMMGSIHMLPFLKMFSRLMISDGEDAASVPGIHALLSDSWGDLEGTLYLGEACFMELWQSIFCAQRQRGDPSRVQAKLLVVPHPSPSPLRQKGGAFVRLRWEACLLCMQQGCGLRHSRLNRKTGSLFRAY